MISSEDIFFGNNYLMIKVNGKYGIIDKEGNKITDFKYDEVYKASIDNMFMISENGKDFIINEKRKKLLDVTEYDVKDILYNRILIEKKEKKV